MLRGKVERKGKWTQMPKAAKQVAHRRVCPCCGRYYGYLAKVESRMILVTEAIHHIFGRRFLYEHCPRFYVHDSRNLVSICNLCHGAIKVIEDSLYRGDVFGFLNGLRALHFPMDRVFQMAKILGFKEVEGWNL
jgi:ribosomal protein S14